MVLAAMCTVLCTKVMIETGWQCDKGRTEHRGYDEINKVGLKCLVD